MAGEKNLPPTEARLRKAREEGQVASSQDLMHSAVCVSVFEGCRLLFLMYHDFASLYFQEFVGQLALLREGHRMNAGNVFAWIALSVGITIVLASVAVVVWIAASWVQTQGPVFKKHPIELKLDKFNPAQAFKNMFSAKTLFDLLGNLVKVAVIGVIFTRAVLAAVHDAPLAIPGGMEAVSLLIGKEILSAVRFTLLALLGVAVLDFGVQRWLTRRDLKMSHEELKEEMKEEQGNPEVKEHMKRTRNEMLDQQKAPDPLAGSNALIVNPTHLAVGLQYRRGEERLPQVRVKAADDEAMSLIELARDRKVPVVRHIWLARTLYECEEGATIPREAFKAVAAVYRMLFQLDEAFNAEQAKKDLAKSWAEGAASPLGSSDTSATKPESSTQAGSDDPDAASNPGSGFADPGRQPPADPSPHDRPGGT